jgi:hypothetical protein
MSPTTVRHPRKEGPFRLSRGQPTYDRRRLNADHCTLHLRRFLLSVE